MAYAAVRSKAMVVVVVVVVVVCGGSLFGPCFVIRIPYTMYTVVYIGFDKVVTQQERAHWFNPH